MIRRYLRSTDLLMEGLFSVLTVIFIIIALVQHPSAPVVFIQNPSSAIEPILYGVIGFGLSSFALVDAFEIFTFDEAFTRIYAYVFAMLILIVVVVHLHTTWESSGADDVVGIGFTIGMAFVSEMNRRRAS